MRPPIFLFSLFFVLNTFSQGEEIEVIGWVKMENSEHFLENASVHIVDTTNHACEIYAFTDPNGRFSAKIPFSTSKFKLIVNHIGYYQYIQEIPVIHQKIRLDTIFLKENGHMLNLVVVQSKPPPILNRSDTAFFDAAYFRNPSIESTADLLEVLPGITIDSEGVMNVNGVPVNKVMINGKPFFKDDFILALQNLPADILESIQVTSTKTKSEAFANEEGSQNAKTINLVILEDKYGGYLGNMGAGGGTNDRFDLQGGINSFGSKGQLSVLASAKNINDPISSTRQASRNGNLNTTQNYGLNFSSALSKKIDINGNYFVIGNKQENETKRLRENFLPNSSFFSAQQAISNNRSIAHTINLGFDFKVNPSLFINISPSLSVQNNENETYDSLASFQSMGTIISGSNGSNIAKGSTKTIGNRFSVTKKTGHKGNVLKFNMSNTLGRAEEERENLFDTYFYTDTGIYNIAQDQTIKIERNNSSAMANVFYKFGLLKQPVSLTIGTTYLHQKNIEKNNVFDNKESGEQTVFNTMLSNDYQLFSQEITPQIKLTYKKKNWSVNTSFSQFYSGLNYDDVLRPQNSLERYYSGSLMTAQTKYQINTKTALNFSYKLTNELPTITQIQPFQNALNPLNIISGNPNLKLQENHQFNLNFQTFDAKKNRGLFAHVNTIFRNNQVVLKSSLDENLIRTTTFTNVSGGYSISGNIRYDKRIVIDSNLTVKLDVRLSPIINRNINFNNGYTYENRIVSLIPKVNSKILFANKNVIEIGYQVFISNTYYGLEQAIDQNLLRHQVYLTTDFHLFSNCVWNNQFLYINSTSSNYTFQQSSSLWHTSISYKFFKQKMEISLVVYDVLNKNVNVIQVATAEYIEDSERNVLNRYALLKLNWKIRSLG